MKIEEINFQEENKKKIITFDEKIKTSTISNMIIQSHLKDNNSIDLYKIEITTIFAQRYYNFFFGIDHIFALPNIFEYSNYCIDLNNKNYNINFEKFEKDFPEKISISEGLIYIIIRF
jgi:hypothetical protein